MRGACAFSAGNLTMARPNSAAHLGFTWVTSAAISMLFVLPGCSAQNPRYRAHVSPDRDPTLIEHAERPVELLQQALDNLDRDLETIVY